ncbi:MAG: VOC family protein [Planctomycetes bacterium]|nr:VOC family protein [Planctomycetota bacterium]
MTARPVPQGFHTVTPYLLVTSARRMLDFAKRAFDAAELECHAAPDGTVMHALARIGNSMVMIGTARDRWPAMPAMLYLYVPDCDAWYRRGLSAGGTSIQPPADQFYGDRVAALSDPLGNQWWIATRKEDLAPDEIARRLEKGGGGGA